MFLGATFRPFPEVWKGRWEATTALSPSRSVAAVHEANKIIFPKLPVMYLFKSHLQENPDEAFPLPTGQACMRHGPTLRPRVPETLHYPQARCA